MKQKRKLNCFSYYIIKYITGILQNSTRQAVTERANLYLKDMLMKQKGIINILRNRLLLALLTLSFLNANEKVTTTMKKHWILEKAMELN